MEMWAKLKRFYTSSRSKSLVPKVIRVVSDRFLPVATLIGNISDWQADYSYYNSYRKYSNRFHCFILSASS